MYNPLRITFISLLLAVAVHSNAQVTANFSATPLSGCKPLLVQFTDLSTGSPTSWNWDFGNLNTSTLQNPAATYVNSGLYTVKLVVSDGVNSDSITFTNYIEVFVDPTAAFSAIPPTSGCVPLTVCFTDQSTPGSAAITDWLWDFGDGNFSVSQNPCHTYTTAGNFPVSLQVTDANGCTNVIVMPGFVSISNPPVPAFTVSPQVACSPPLNVQFTNNSTGCQPLTYWWDFGDGSPPSAQANPPHTYAVSGIFDITLIVTDCNGCKDTLVKQNFVQIAQPQSNFNAPDTVCPNEPVNFQNTSVGGGAWFWDYGDNSSLWGFQFPHTYSSPGTYTVKLITYSGNCTDTIYKTIVVEEVIADFELMPSYGCELPHTVTFSDSSTSNVVAWHWDFGVQAVGWDTSNVQNPQWTYFQPGNYIVCLTVTTAHGCTSTHCDTVNIYVMTPAFLPDTFSGCAPLTVDFTDLSTPQDTIVSWHWDFDDGDTSNVQNPSHTFMNPGEYMVCLTITNAYGCDTVFCLQIEVGTPQMPGFYWQPDTACAWEGIQFFDTSQVDTLIDYWQWYFGDGGSSNDQNPWHQYTDTGWMNVTLIVGYNGCYDTLTIDSAVYILGPVVFMGYTYNCDTPYTYHFSSTIIDAHRWYWDFGDGSPLDSVSTAPTYTYLASSDYWVHLEAYNDSTGCFYKDSMLVYVRDIQAAFTQDTFIGCPGLTVTFDAGSGQDEFEHWYQFQTGLWQWNFGDNVLFPNGFPDTITNDSIIQHTFNGHGTYTVTLMVVDINGCPDTAIAVVKTYKPSADFTADTAVGCQPLTVDFMDQSTGDTTLVKWEWSFPGGSPNTDTGQTATSSYSGTGSYFVTIIVTDTLGCKDTTMKANFVTVTQPIPAMVADDNTICVGDLVTFINNSINGSTYFWDFGDGNTSTAFQPSNTYIDTGYFTITLTVTDTNGCDSTINYTDYMHVQAYPFAGFKADTLIGDCYPLLVQFLDTSWGDYITSWQWYFGDSASSTQQNPIHNYVSPGTYDVTLVVTTSYGCKDSITYTQYIVVKGPQAQMNMFPDSICKGDTVWFEMINDTNVYSFTFDFGDGYTDTISPTWHVYNEVGTIYTFFTYQDSSALCEKYAQDTLYIYEVLADFGRDDTVGCEPFTVTFTDSSTGASTWQWDFGDGQPIELGPTPSPHTFDSAGTYWVQLMVGNAIGCVDTILKGITVHPNPAVIADDDTLICWGDSIRLQALGSPGVVSYQWSPSTGLSNDTVADPWAFPDQTTIYTVVATDVNGCTDSYSMEVVVHQVPTIITQSDTAIIIGEIIQINTYSQPGVSYHWSPPDGLSCTDCPNPIANPLVTTLYTLTIIDSIGCFEITIQVLIEVIEEYTIDVPTAFTPNGDGINDIIYVKGWGVKELQEFKIFNRWGQKVFESNDINVGWDGFFNGEQQNVETYVYVVNALMYNGEQFSKKGYISLLR